MSFSVFGKGNLEYDFDNRDECLEELKELLIELLNERVIYIDDIEELYNYLKEGWEC